MIQLPLLPPPCVESYQARGDTATVVSMVCGGVHDGHAGQWAWACGAAWGWAEDWRAAWAAVETHQDGA